MKYPIFCPSWSSTRLLLSWGSSPASQPVRRRGAAEGSWPRVWHRATSRLLFHVEGWDQVDSPHTGSRARQTTYRRQKRSPEETGQGKMKSSFLLWLEKRTGKPLGGPFGGFFVSKVASECFLTAFQKCFEILL